jgi:hypothetical protein
MRAVARTFILPNTDHHFSAALFPLLCEPPDVAARSSDTATTNPSRDYFEREVTLVPRDGKRGVNDFVLRRPEVDAVGPQEHIEGDDSESFVAILQRVILDERSKETRRLVVDRSWPGTSA